MIELFCVIPDSDGIERDCLNHLRGDPGSRTYQTMYTKQYYVYILASQRNGTLYIGIINNLITRIYQHRNKTKETFTSKYDVGDLVYYEHTKDIESAIAREKQLKKWQRRWKIELIEATNPHWEDLFPKLS